MGPAQCLMYERADWAGVFCERALRAVYAVVKSYVCSLRHSCCSEAVQGDSEHVEYVRC